MDYLLFADGILIATFKNEMDRNDCLELLKEKYKDCKFTIK